MDEAVPDDGLADHQASPVLLSLSPITPIPPPSTRRLSSCFVQPSRPLSSVKQLSWMSLQGRLVNAEEASSVRTIGGGLSPEQAVAWELFSPIQRFLIVAVIGVAVAESKKNQRIWQLEKSVELRDQVLSRMQQKFDNLCEQLNDTKEHSITAINNSFPKNEESPQSETFGLDKIKFVDCGCWLCDQHYNFFNGLKGSSDQRVSIGNEVLQYKMSFSNEEQEERRMSDLSDWASSVTSAAEIQSNSLAIEQDICNLKRDCERKDATIKEMTTLLNTSEVANSKRVAELEDIIRRKNGTITKLKKDMVVLEQKVVQLSRLRRPSFSGCDTNGDQLLHMRDNLLYDMESSTSPSSSDSDTSPVNHAQVSTSEIDDVLVPSKESSPASNQKSKPAKATSSSERTIEFELSSGSGAKSPLQEISSNLRSNVASSKQKQLLARVDLMKGRRRSLSGTNSVAAQKRWV